MDTDVSRVLRLFRLSVPPVFFLLACYVFLGEHVFGLAYIVGNRLKPSLRTTLRVCYRLASACIALFMHLYLWYACSSDEASVCPPTRFGERNCLAITSTCALYCGATLLVERWANPLFHLGHPTGTRVRACAAAGIMVIWMTIADQQLCAHLLLLLFTARRTLQMFPTVGHGYALAIKFYAMLHMSRILTQRCDGIPKLAVATVATMSVM
jgi:hypothetical protein